MSGRMASQEGATVMKAEKNTLKRVLLWIVLLLLILLPPLILMGLFASF